MKKAFLAHWAVAMAFVLGGCSPEFVVFSSLMGASASALPFSSSKNETSNPSSADLKDKAGSPNDYHFLNITSFHGRQAADLLDLRVLDRNDIPSDVFNCEITETEALFPNSDFEAVLSSDSSQVLFSGLVTSDGENSLRAEIAGICYEVAENNRAAANFVSFCLSFAQNFGNSLTES